VGAGRQNQVRRPTPHDDAGGLNKLLTGDAAFQRQGKPTLDQFATFFEVDRPNDVVTLPCHIDSQVKLPEAVRPAERPISRAVYRGEQMKQPVRVEIIRKYAPAPPGLPVSAESAWQRLPTMLAP
jgi:hypothetical protein